MNYIKPSQNQIISPVPVSGANDDEQIIIKDSVNQHWLLVGADADYCIFEAVEHREIGDKPRTRTMPLKQLQALYGWGKKCQFTRPLPDGIGIEVYVGFEPFGFALAEPIWAYRSDDAEIDVDFERDRMSKILDRDEDRVSGFAMSARDGYGAVI